MEDFSGHAMRKTVNPTDVSLAARKQPLIVSRLADLCSTLEEGKRKRRKKGDSDS